MLNKDVKKLLVSGVALLMLTTAGTGLASTTNVNASRRSGQVTKLERQKRYYSKKLAKVNRELARLNDSHKHVYVHKHHAHHESLAMWYYHHAKRLYHHHINTSKSFRNGYNDGNMDLLNMDHVNGKMYHQGWIVGFSGYNTNMFTNYPSKHAFRNAVYEFGQGKTYARNNNVTNLWYDNNSSSWSGNNN